MAMVSASYTSRRVAVAKSLPSERSSRSMTASRMAPRLSGTEVDTMGLRDGAFILLIRVEHSLGDDSPSPVFTHERQLLVHSSGSEPLRKRRDATIRSLRSDLQLDR